MSNKKSNNKPNNNKKVINPLIPVSLIVLVVALFLVISDSMVGLKKDNNSAVAIKGSETVNSGGISTNEEGDVVIQPNEITNEASFYEYDYSGTPVGLFVVKASDGTIRTALNTCQVCNGSPKAFFEQQGDQFQCQNCGNLFNLDMIGEERGGCNPIPITVEERTASENGSIIIPANYLEGNATLFTNWKKN